MKTQALGAACAVSLMLAACAPTGADNSTYGALGGAAVGFLTAEALDANPQWTVVSVLAGAAAGTLVARNQTSRSCAYARGDGTYYTAACPA